MAMIWWIKSLIETGFGTRIESWPILATRRPPLTAFSINVAAAAFVFAVMRMVQLGRHLRGSIRKWLAISLLLLIGGRAIAGVVSGAAEPGVWFIPVYGAWDGWALATVYIAALLWGWIFVWSLTLGAERKG